MKAIVDKHVELGTSIAVVAREMKDLAEGSLETAVAKALDPVKEQVSRLMNIVTQVAQLTKTPDILTTTATSASVSIPPTTSSMLDDGNGLYMVSDSAVTASKLTRKSTVNTDRLRNVVIFGIDNTHNSSEWYETGWSTLRVAAGREVSVDDAFRLGTPSANKKRPVLVKLHS